MKAGIAKGNGFGERWVEYCRENGIDYKLVDVYASDVVKQLEGCDLVLWHFSHVSYKDMLFAKQLAIVVLYQCILLFFLAISRRSY